MPLTVTIRPAAPADGEAAIPLILSSGPQAFDYVFTLAGGIHVRDFLRQAFLDGAGEFGWRNHTVAAVDGKVVGVGACYGSDRNFAFLAAGARQIVSAYGLRAPGVMVRGLRTEAVIRPPATGEWTLVHLGVYPALRSRGIGRRIIEDFLVRGKAAGAKKAVLDVAVTNPRAQALYEGLGFSLEAERLSALHNAVSKVPAHLRMSRAL